MVGQPFFYFCLTADSKRSVAVKTQGESLVFKIMTAQGCAGNAQTAWSEATGSCWA